MNEAEKREWLDLGAGLGLLVPQYQDRMMAAMLRLEKEGLAGDLEHITALALVRLVMQNEDEPWMHEIWRRLSQNYHDTECPVCEGLRSHQCGEGIVKPFFRFIGKFFGRKQNGN